MDSAAIDPLELGQRLAHLLESGRREATYKLVTLRALVDAYVERPGLEPDTAVLVPFADLAHRVLAGYWQQARPFGTAGVLQQTVTGTGIVQWIAAVRQQLGQAGRSAAVARVSNAPQYRRLHTRVTHHLARYPLTHLQNVSGAISGAWTDDFLFNSSGLHKKMRVTDIEARGGVLLRPGVARGLALLAPMIRPVIDLLWVEDVARMNAHELDRDPLPAFLFGTTRIALACLAGPLRTLQDNRCFYCDRRLLPPADVDVDHVIPWSRAPIDGVANLVVADSRCNRSKSASLPAVALLERALDRDPDELDRIALISGVPVQRRRTLAAALGPDLLT